MELKTLATTILGLAIVGVILYAIETYIPMSPPIKMLIRIIIVIAVVYYLITKYL